MPLSDDGDDGDGIDGSDGGIGGVTDGGGEVDGVNCQRNHLSS